MFSAFSISWVYPVCLASERLALWQRPSKEHGRCGKTSSPLACSTIFPCTKSCSGTRLSPLGDLDLGMSMNLAPPISTMSLSCSLLISLFLMPVA